MTAPFAIAGREIGPGRPVYVIAELSANHGGSYDTAAGIVHAAKAAGADAIKLQTYTADTITIESDAPLFRHGGGSLWEGKTLHGLYQEASMPWAWQPGLKVLAESLGLHCFSSPFDPTAVEFLEEIDVPAYKVASFELVDLPLVRRMAETGKPMIISTGMATEAEIDEAVTAARDAGATQIALLKCTSAYPSPPEALNLGAIPVMAARWGVPIGLSDHTVGESVAVAAVALGATIVEKHITLTHDQATPDSPFSLDASEFKRMVDAIRVAEQALAGSSLGPTPEEEESRKFRRSLFVVEDVAAGEPLTDRNVRSIRPAAGMHTRHFEEVLGRRAAGDIASGTPLAWELLEPAAEAQPPR
jgi:N-acetylneuraminate synthase